MNAAPAPAPDRASDGLHATRVTVTTPGTRYDILIGSGVLAAPDSLALSTPAMSSRARVGRNLQTGGFRRERQREARGVLSRR